MRTTMVLLSLLAPAAMAAELPDYCRPLQQVMRAAPFCQENVIFVQAAQECLDKVDAEVHAYQRSLTAVFADRGARSVSAQDAKYVNHDGNLTDTSASLTTILRDATEARNELLDYLAQLRYPGDPHPGLRERRRLTPYLAEFPCYHDRHEALVARINTLGQWIADLRRTKGSDLALLKRSSGDLHSLGADARGPASAVSHSAGVGRGAIQGGRSSNGASTITGRIHDEKLP